MAALYVVLRSGDYTATLNGKRETAQRVGVVGIYDDPAVAQRVAENTPVEGGWGETCTWVDTAVVNAPPVSE